MKAFVILIFLIGIQHLNAQWGYMGLGNTRVTDLTVYSDTLYASTYDGIYKKHIFSMDTVWVPCGMQGNHVVQTVLPNHRTLICTVEIDSTNRTRIYKSINGGLSFTLLDTSLSHPMEYNFLDKIAHPANTYDTLYFVSHLRKTFDGGATWSSMNEVFWAHFIEVDPTNHSRLIVSGEGLLFNAILLTSFDFGNSWSPAGMNGYFSGDNALHALAINGNDWFGTGEGIICKTTDAGENWIQLLNTWSYPPQWVLYIFDISFSPSDKTKLYATGDGHSTKRVPLLYSADYGLNWDTLSYSSSHLPHIISLTVKSTANGDIVFLGGQGVFRYENIFISIRTHQQSYSPAYSLSNSYPNPFNPITTIEFYLPIRNHVTLKIFDLPGREVATLIDENLPEGSHKIRWDGSGHSGGIYLYCLQAGTYREIKKLILLR